MGKERKGGGKTHFSHFSENLRYSFSYFPAEANSEISPHGVLICQVMVPTSIGKQTHTHRACLTLIKWLQSGLVLHLVRIVVLIAQFYSSLKCSVNVKGMAETHLAYRNPKISFYRGFVVFFFFFTVFKNLFLHLACAK